MEKVQLELQAKFWGKKAAILKQRDEKAAAEPDFWKRAFEVFAISKLGPLDLWSEDDDRALGSLESVLVQHDEKDYNTITVTMTFSEDEERPFANKELVKKVTLSAGDSEDEEKEGDIIKRTKLEITTFEAKAGSKRNAEPNLTFFTFFENDDCTGAINLSEFYQEAHNFFLGLVDDDDSDEGGFLMMGEDDDEEDGEDGEEGDDE